MFAPPFLAELRDIARLEPKGLALNEDAMAFDRIGQPLRRLEFLQRQLRLAMDRMTQGEQLLGQAVDRRADIFLQLFQRHSADFATTGSS